MKKLENLTRRTLAMSCTPSVFSFRPLKSYCSFGLPAARASSRGPSQLATVNKPDLQLSSLQNSIEPSQANHESKRVASFLSSPIYHFWLGDLGSYLTWKVTYHTFNKYYLLVSADLTYVHVWCGVRNFEPSPNTYHLWQWDRSFD